MSLKIGSLFSGVGGLDLAVEAFFDAQTAWHCEFDPEPSKVLAARWPGVPNFGDVTTVDWSTVEPVDIACGGSPCQDVSAAGRRAGMVEGTRSNLWVAMREAIAVLKPSVVIWENVRGALSAYAYSEMESEPGLLGESYGPDRAALRAAGRVVGDLSDLGYDAQWVTLPASAVGAPHRRERVFVVAHARGEAREFWAGFRPSEPGRVGWGRPEGTDSWLARRERVKQTASNGNGMGMPLAIAVQLLPTPVTTDAAGTRNATANRRTDSGHSGKTLTDALLPTPQVADATGGHATRSGERSSEMLLPGVAAASTETMSGDRQGNVTGAVSWGEYEPAVRLWESITRPAPAPTLPDGKNGNHRLAAVFPEWMMGYALGWVTDILSRNPAIRACGNGVVPQQAYAALEVIWPRVIEALEAA